MFKHIVAVVTGGASGLGLATAKRLAAKGSRVVVCDLPTSNGAEVAKSIGGETIFVPTDVSSVPDVQNLMKVTKEKFGALNAIVNCAGISNSYLTYNQLTKKSHDLSDFHKVFNVNTAGAFNVICQSLELMTENPPDENGQRGVIVNTTSSQAFVGCQGGIAMAASSAATIAMTRTFTKELAEYGIRVNAIAVGLFDTPLTNFMPDHTIEPLVETCLDFPKRLGHPDEFAHMVQTILANQYLNGSIIQLDANMHVTL